MKFFPTAILWLVLSGSLVLFLRPYALRKFKKPSNVNLTDPVAVSMTNLVGVVEATVGDELHPGRVKIHGELWNAVTTGDELPVGTRIQVEKALGTKLWITPLS
jgi:membrane protein implicated in regulation of membrane protease activity